MKRFNEFLVILAVVSAMFGFYKLARYLINTIKSGKQDFTLEDQRIVDKDAKSWEVDFQYPKQFDEDMRKKREELIKEFSFMEYGKA